MPELRKKIALYTSSFPPRAGGVASAHYNLYQILKDNYNVKVFVYNDRNAKKSEIVVSELSHVRIKRVISFLYRRYFSIPNKKHCSGENILKTIHAVKKLNKELKKFNPDFIIVPDNRLPALHLKKGKSKILWIAHHNYYRFIPNEIIDFYNIKDINFAIKRENEAIQKADIIICPSNYMLNIQKKTYNVNAPHFVIPNYISFERVEMIEKQNVMRIIGVIEKYPIVYIPSAFSEIKGARFVKKIVKNISNKLNNKVAFYLTGDGNLDLDERYNIFAPGHISWEENISYIKDCTIGVSPTLLDNLSMGIIEGLYLKIPFIAFDTGGNKEIIENGVNGWVVEYLNVDALIDKTVYYLKNINELKKISNNTMLKITSYNDKNTILNKFKEVFEILKKK